MVSKKKDNNKKLTTAQKEQLEDWYHQLGHYPSQEKVHYETNLSNLLMCLKFQILHSDEGICNETK